MNELNEFIHLPFMLSKLKKFQTLFHYHYVHIGGAGSQPLVRQSFTLSVGWLGGLFITKYNLVSQSHLTPDRIQTV